MGFGVWGSGFGVWGLGFRILCHPPFNYPSYPKSEARDCRWAPMHLYRFRFLCRIRFPYKSTTPNPEPKNLAARSCFSVGCQGGSPGYIASFCCTGLWARDLGSGCPNIKAPGPKFGFGCLKVLHLKAPVGDLWLGSTTRAYTFKAPKPRALNLKLLWLLELCSPFGALSVRPLRPPHVLSQVCFQAPPFPLALPKAWAESRGFWSEFSKAENLVVCSISANLAKFSRGLTQGCVRLPKRYPSIKQKPQFREP